MDLNILAIGSRVREQREIMKMSRERLAEIIGISEYYIGQLERGQRQMSLTVACAVAECLHISLDYLIWGIEVDDKDKGLLQEYSGPYSDTGRSREINELLHRCSDYELVFVQHLLQLVLPYIRRQPSDPSKN